MCCDSQLLLVQYQCCKRCWSRMHGAGCSVPMTCIINPIASDWHQLQNHWHVDITLLATKSLTGHRPVVAAVCVPRWTLSGSSASPSPPPTLPSAPPLAEMWQQCTCHPMPAPMTPTRQKQHRVSCRLLTSTCPAGRTRQHGTASCGSFSMRWAR